MLDVPVVPQGVLMTDGRATAVRESYVEVAIERRRWARLASHGS